MRIRLATLNVWALPEPIGRDVSARMRAIGERIADLDLDVLLLQEVWTGAARKTLRRAGQRAGLAHFWHRDSIFGGSGLLVLSRLPMEEVRFEPFVLPVVPARPDHPDYYGGKGFVRLRLATPAGPVDVIDTHLQARYARDVPHEYRAYRVGQIVQLAARTVAPREPLVIAGDFNFEQSDPEYRILSGLTRARDAAIEAGTPQPTVFRGNPLRRVRDGRRIDYVFLKDGSSRRLLARRVERVFDDVFEVDGRPSACSDHAGVLAELEVEDGVTVRSAPDAGAAQLARSLLAEGHERAEQFRRQGRTVAGVGIGAAIIATAGMRDRRVTRRRLLRGAVFGAGALALGPGLGSSILAEFYAPAELRAFERLAKRVEGFLPLGFDSNA